MFLSTYFLSVLLPLFFHGFCGHLTTGQEKPFWLAVMYHPACCCAPRPHPLDPPLRLSFPMNRWHNWLWFKPTLWIYHLLHVNAFFGPLIAALKLYIYTALHCKFANTEIKHAILSLSSHVGNFKDILGFEKNIIKFSRVTKSHPGCLISDSHCIAQNCNFISAVDISMKIASHLQQEPNKYNWTDESEQFEVCLSWPHNKHNLCWLKDNILSETNETVSGWFVRDWGDRIQMAELI